MAEEGAFYVHMGAMVKGPCGDPLTHYYYRQPRDGDEVRYGIKSIPTFEIRLASKCWDCMLKEHAEQITTHAPAVAPCK